MVRQGIRLNTETTKAQILKIASYIFYRDGYEKGSLNAVARKVGISKAAIYYHFKNKEEILYNIIIDDIDRLILDLGEISKRKDDPIRELKEMVDVQVSYMSQKINAKIVFEDGNFLSKKYQEILRKRQKEIVKIYKNKLKEIASVRKLKDINITVAKFSVLGIINWLYQWYNPKGKMSMEKIKENIIKIIFYGTIQEDQ
jgi:TetR/AcrR family transcriptional regulator, cholesterol catabolism regulator